MSGYDIGEPLFIDRVREAPHIRGVLLTYVTSRMDPTRNLTRSGLERGGARPVSMKITLECPACGARYQLDESRLTAATRLSCSKCGKQWTVGVPSSPERSGEVQAQPSRPMPAAAPPVRPAPPSAPTPGAAAAVLAASFEVLCPECGHRFDHEPSVDAGRRRRILVVEDQDYFSSLTREAIGDGYDMVFVRTPAAALKEIARHRPDLLILDLILEGGEGKEVLEKRADRSFPVLVFTSKDEREMFGGKQWDQLKALGANDLLMKGINVGDDLQRKVEVLLGER